MRSFSRVALAVLVSLGAAACAGSRKQDSREAAFATTPRTQDDVDMALKDYQVVWTRGGKVGYVRSFSVSKPNEPTVTLHYVCGRDFVDLGWCSDDGQGERFVYPEEK